MPNIRVLATDLEFPEGPVAMPDGSVILVEIRGQRLTRVYPDGRKETVAQMPGGPNGAALGPDGKMYVCNNGGFTWTTVNGRNVSTAAASDYKGGSLQRVDLQSGKVETLFDKCGEFKLNGPNDLVFDKGGGIWFTDLGKRLTLLAAIDHIGRRDLARPRDRKRPDARGRRFGDIDGLFVR